MKKIQLSIPEPCHENWNQMRPDEKGKFCKACQKTVIDFSTMSDRDLVAFFKTPVHSVCGHFQKNQLDRDILIPQKRIPWIKYVFQFAIPAFLVSQKSAAQGKVVAKDTTVCTPAKGRIYGHVRMIPETMKNISGSVTDSDGNPLAFTSVNIKNNINGTVTDTGGKFQLNIPVKSTLVFSMVGFQTKEVNTEIDTELNVIMEYDQTVSSETFFAGLVVYTKPEPIPLINKLLDSAFSRFSVYPNPVASHAPIQIKLLRQYKGEYRIDLFNSAGALVLKREINVVNNKEIISLNVGDLNAGNYFLRLTEKKTGKQFTEKIVVE